MEPGFLGRSPGRNQAKGELAKADLERTTGKRIFAVIRMDLSEKESVRSALDRLPAIDALVMNAGGSGGTAPLDLTRDGVTNLFAQNVLGHVVLLEELIRSQHLNSMAIYVSSEAARGIPMAGIKRPHFISSSVKEFERVITGEDPKEKKLSPMSAYGEVKYLGTLWMSALARRNSNLRLLTVSPGGTKGTQFSKLLPAPALAFFEWVVMPVGSMFGLVHSLEKGAKRIVDALFDPNMKSGEFYASKEGKTTGPLVSQKLIFSDLADKAIQDNAMQAIHRFTQ